MHKLTKQILLQFDKQTKRSNMTIIQEYLKRCAQEPGEIEGLLNTSQLDSDEYSDSEDGLDDDDEYYDEEIEQYRQQSNG